MDADLDTLCTFVYCTADDLLPERKRNARRATIDAEIVTLAVAQASRGEPSDRRFLRRAKRSLSHLFPVIPGQAGYFKRRRRLARLLEWLLVIFAEQGPGFADDSHSRYFWGVRLHAIFACDGTPRALTYCSPKRDEREVGLALLDSCQRKGGETLLCDKGYAGREFASAVKDLEATVARPKRRDEPGAGPHLAPMRQRIESVFWTGKDILTLEHHRARTIEGLKERILQRFVCLAACISLNYQLGRPSRALVDYYG